MPEKQGSLESVILQRMLDQLGAAGDVIDEMARQTFIGGKRVTRQDVPALDRAAGATVHRVKVSLHGAKPPIWRRLEVPSVITLDDLHDVLQTAFGWYGCHLHQFETTCGEFGDPSQDDDWSERGDEGKVALAQVAAEKSKIVYTYDFGDDWRHDIVVEKILPAEPGVAYPRCTGGRREAPEEDSGGIDKHNDAAGQEQADGGFSHADVTAALSEVAAVLVPRLP